MICVLDVIGGPARGKRIWVKEDQCFEIGRISTADFSIPSDAHMSRRHLILDSTQSEFRVRDMSSANGTYVNDKRIEVQRIASGDRIRAGMSTFLVSIKEDWHNPHEQDGIRFSSLGSVEAAPVSATMEQDSAPEEPVKDSEPKPQETANARVIEFGERLDLESTVRIVQSNDPDASHVMRRSTMEPGNWFEPYFESQLAPSVFEQTKLFASSAGEMVGLAQKFTKGQFAGMVVNMSQLNPATLKRIENAASRLKAQYISQTLCFIPCDESSLFWEVLQNCQGMDAVICLWRQNEFSGKDVGAFANALGFPSLFTKHLCDESHRLNKELAKAGFHAIFEIDISGHLGLFLPSHKT